MIAVGELAYDPSRLRLYKYERAISLGLAPLRLLVFLMEHSEQSFETDTLVRQLWGEQVVIDEQARAVIRRYVKCIRQAIEDGAGPWLVSEKSRGYGLWTSPPVTRAEHLVGCV